MPTPTPFEIVKALRDLNLLEKKLEKSRSKAKIKTEIEEIRAQIPAPILSHHDRIVVKGRSSTAVVRNWTCSSCHIQVPRGMRSKLHKMDDLFVCENCGSYLYLEEAMEPQAAAVAAS